MRALGLDPAAALRIVSEDSADADPANADADADARSATQSARDRFTAARDAAPSVPEGWRPSSLFATDSAADEPERTDVAVERDRADALPGIGPGERVKETESFAAAL